MLARAAAAGRPRRAAARARAAGRGRGGRAAAAAAAAGPAAVVVTAAAAAATARRPRQQNYADVFDSRGRPARPKPSADLASPSHVLTAVPSAATLGAASRRARPSRSARRPARARRRLVRARRAARARPSVSLAVAVAAEALAAATTRAPPNVRPSALARGTGGCGAESARALRDAAGGLVAELCAVVADDGRAQPHARSSRVAALRALDFDARDDDDAMLEEVACPRRFAWRSSKTSWATPRDRPGFARGARARRARARAPRAGRFDGGPLSSLVRAAIALVEDDLALAAHQAVAVADAARPPADALTGVVRIAPTEDGGLSVVTPRRVADEDGIGLHFLRPAGDDGLLAPGGDDDEEDAVPTVTAASEPSVQLTQFLRFKVCGLRDDEAANSVQIACFWF